LKMPAFEWVHVQLHQQKGMISLSPPTICNSARTRECMKNVWYNKNIINKIECCSVDNLQSLLSIIAAKMKSMIYQK
ncbi:hypothetical protein, partial [Klebsiella pneumoniae]|uniref:hypothetical protein n=1 Tax=Klebsiella pneumoniae TaxID=573 RepID=UPI001C6FD1EF